MDFGYNNGGHVRSSTVTNVPLWCRILIEGEDVPTWKQEVDGKLYLPFNFVMNLRCVLKTKLSFSKAGMEVIQGGTSGKEPTSQLRRQKRPRFGPWVGNFPWRRAWQPTPAFLPAESHGQRSLVGHGPWGHKESDTTEN